MNLCSKSFEVTLPDVGEDNLITNKGFLRMFQEIGAIHSKMFGFGLNDAKKTGLFWIILNWKLKVLTRPKWNEKINVSTWCSNYTHIYFYREFKAYDEEGNVIAIATSKWILFDFNKSAVFKITNNFLENYCKTIDNTTFETKLVEKFKEPEKIEYICDYTILNRDIDSNHHVNNLNYLDFAYEAIFKKNIKNPNFNNVEIMYKHEAKIGENIKLFYSKDEEINIITIKNSDDNRLHCIIKLY